MRHFKKAHKTILPKDVSAVMMKQGGDREMMVAKVKETKGEDIKKFMKPLDRARLMVQGVSIEHGTKYKQTVLGDFLKYRNKSFKTNISSSNRQDAQRIVEEEENMSEKKNRGNKEKEALNKEEENEQS